MNDAYTAKQNCQNNQLVVHDVENYYLGQNKVFYFVRQNSGLGLKMKLIEIELPKKKKKGSQFDQNQSCHHYEQLNWLCQVSNHFVSKLWNIVPWSTGHGLYDQGNHIRQLLHLLA